MRTKDQAAWWRRPRVVVALVGIVVLGAVAVVAVVDRGGEEAPDPVVASTHTGYPARGDLVAAGGWEPEAEAAAEVWRAVPAGGETKPPEMGREIQLMWAGDVEARDLPYAREHLRDEAGELGTARLLLLQSFNQLAAAVAPVGSDGERTGDYTLVSEAIAWPGDAAISPRDGVLLLAETSDVVDSVRVAGQDEAVAVHDGLVLGAPPGVIRHEQAFAHGREEYQGLVLTESGRTVAVRDDALWQALDDPVTSARTERALRDAYEDARPRTSGSALPLAALWEPVELEDGRSVMVVAVQADGTGGRDPSWVVVGGLNLPGATGASTRVVRLGAGQPPGLVHAGERRGPVLAARWFEPEQLGTSHPQLVVVGGPGITEVEVLTADGVQQLPGTAAALPAWEDDGSGPVMSRAVVVGHTADGGPVTPLPAGQGHPTAES
ncbi:hypothetical protein GCM10009718_27420 [Isoptericola halotolerans]|uniref:Uncharacterized protein n=1 Tax=Isoptericola halotolerans TaxID=300560 RepID=A0ABX2A3G0_9MICO|nr:hypothetical protein [Isoptericola halotolerans]NOV97407.1 hypothetical protein [Isoptericola halotolerans]